MQDKDKNRDPEKARKRAAADLRCAIRKLGFAEAMEILADMASHQHCLRGFPRQHSAPDRARRRLNTLSRELRKLAGHGPQGRASA